MSISVIVDNHKSEAWELIHQPPKEPPQEDGLGGRSRVEFQNYKTKPEKVVLQPYNQPPKSFQDPGTLYPRKTSSTPSQHIFEQIEFQGTPEGEHVFNLVLELYAEVGKDGQSQHLIIATSLSEPMWITRESPSHVKRAAHTEEHRTYLE
jgi:hypothetical protein